MRPYRDTVASTDALSIEMITVNAMARPTIPAPGQVLLRSPQGHTGSTESL